MLLPKLTTLLLCDSVGKAPDGRKTLFGLIDHASFESFPARLPRCSIFGRFGSGQGTFEASFSVRGPSENIVFETPEACTFNLEDPLQTADLVLMVDNLLLPEPGTYWIEGWLEGERLPIVATLFVDQNHDGKSSG